ncbi:hypothetical protein DRN73_06325 [Candidatus Pacearchaeota archaeon]|nr:MAG: hypothetical protein DRN73_06325 [Candidatus Pacearchaeota archaeon]
MNKKVKYLILFCIGIIILFLFILFLTPLKITLNFYIEQTNESLSGKVYLNDEYLGEAINGTLSVTQDKLYPGEISLKGKYEGKNFEFLFTLDRNYESYNSLDYVISQDEIDLLLLTNNSLKFSETEDEIFLLLNQEREKEGLPPLKRKAILDSIARDYAKEMAENAYFSHTTPQGKDLTDRLIEKNIFHFVANENIAFLQLSPGEDLAEDFVQGWLKSPGHRSTILDRDNIYTHVGIGVYCIQDEGYPTCYGVTEFVGLELNFGGEIKRNYYSFYKIYSEDYGFSFDVPVTIELNASVVTEFMLVEETKDYDRFLSRNSYNKIFRKIGKNFILDDIIIKPGYGLIIGSTKDDTLFNVSVIPK